MTYLTAHPSAALNGLRQCPKLPKSYKELTWKELSLLASILSHQPPPTLPISASQHRTYARLTKTDIEKLPPRLQDHPNIIVRYLNRRWQDDERTSHRDLCPTHIKLNRNITHSLCRFIQNEIDISIPAIIDTLSNVNTLPLSIRRQFQELREVSGMWLSPESYSKRFEKVAPSRWQFQQDGCPACIISRLGGESQVLISLKAGMLTRFRTCNRSKRHAFVDALINEGFVEDEAVQIEQSAADLGAELNFILRKLLVEQQRQNNQNRSFVIRKHNHNGARVSLDKLSLAETDTPCNDDTLDIDGVLKDDGYNKENQRSYGSHALSRTCVPQLDAKLCKDDECENDIYKEIDELIDDYRKTVCLQQESQHVNVQNSALKLRATALGSTSTIQPLHVRSPPTHVASWDDLLPTPRIISGNTLPVIGGQSACPTEASSHSPPRTGKDNRKGKAKAQAKDVYHTTSAHKGAPAYALSYQNLLNQSNLYQRTEHQHIPSPAESEDTTWGGFISRVKESEKESVGALLMFAVF
jgi:hypothetical protein